MRDPSGRVFQFMWQLQSIETWPCVGYSMVTPFFHIKLHASRAAKLFTMLPRKIALLFLFMLRENYIVQENVADHDPFSPLLYYWIFLGKTNVPQFLL